MLYYSYTQAEGSNLNSCYYETLDKNFNEAIKLCETEFSHNELISMLKNGNIPQKQIAALKLDNICSIDDAQTLVKNLTGQDGKIREAVSLKLVEFMNNPNTIMFFQNPETFPVFLNAIVDINANICRNVLSAIRNLKSNTQFCNFICFEITKMIMDLLKKIEQFDEREGKYKVNKELFKLYWSLECVWEFSDYFHIDTLKTILMKTKSIDEYTIREKTAKILSKIFCDAELNAIKMELKQDSNYYVKKY